MTAVLSCDCKSEFQDQNYGVGKRVHNRSKPATTAPKSFRCTVCGKERLEGAAKKKGKKDDAGKEQQSVTSTKSKSKGK